MKTVRRILSLLLMGYGGISGLIFLANALFHFDAKGNTASWIVMAVPSIGILWAGWLLWPDKPEKKGRKAAAPKKVSPQRKKSVPFLTEKVLQPVAEPAAPKTPWEPQTPAAVLYTDEYAVHSARGSMQQLKAGIRMGTGKPGIYWVVGWNGGRHGEGAGGWKDLPEDVLANLNPDSFTDWVMKDFEDTVSPADWADIRKKPQLAQWCQEVREYLQLSLPEDVLMVNNPFDAELSGVGPDGLYNRSGIRCWVGLKNPEQHIAQVVDQLLAWQEKNRPKIGPDGCFLMLKQGTVLDGQLTASQINRCKAAHLTMATMEDNLLLDLLSGTAYRLVTQEYPGSADDAATYGEWAPDEVPSAKRAPAKPASETGTDDHY